MGVLCFQGLPGDVAHNCTPPALRRPAVSRQSEGPRELHTVCHSLKSAPDPYRHASSARLTAYCALSGSTLLPDRALSGGEAANNRQDNTRSGQCNQTSCCCSSQHFRCSSLRNIYVACCRPAAPAELKVLNAASPPTCSIQSASAAGPTCAISCGTNRGSCTPTHTAAAAASAFEQCAAWLVVTGGAEKRAGEHTPCSSQEVPKLSTPLHHPPALSVLPWCASGA